MKDPVPAAPANAIGFKIINSTGEDIPVYANLPEAYSEYRLPGTTAYNAAHAGNVYLFQHIHQPHFDIWDSNYLTKTACEVYSIVTRPIIELQFLLQSEILYKIDGLQWESLKETQYNLLASPPTTTDRVRFTQNNKHTFDIHLQSAFLKKLANRIPQLRTFVQQVVAGQQAQFFDTPQFAAPKTLYLITKLITEIREQRGIQPQHGALVEAIITSALTNPYSNKPYRILYHEIEYIYQAERIASENLDEPARLPTSINEAYVHPSKFRFLFKSIFHLLPNAYLTKKRMEEAQKLLKTFPDLSIQTVALRVGYDNPSRFSAVYKKYYGRTPSMERKI